MIWTTANQFLFRFGQYYSKEVTLHGFNKNPDILKNRGAGEVQKPPIFDLFCFL